MCLVSLRKSSLPDDSDDDKDDICIACYVDPASPQSHTLRVALIILHYTMKKILRVREIQLPV